MVYCLAILAIASFRYGPKSIEDLNKRTQFLFAKKCQKWPTPWRRSTSTRWSESSLLQCLFNFWTKQRKKCLDCTFGTLGKPFALIRIQPNAQMSKNYSINWGKGKSIPLDPISAVNLSKLSQLYFLRATEWTWTNEFNGTYLGKKWAINSATRTSNTNFRENGGMAGMAHLHRKNRVPHFWPASKVADYSANWWFLCSILLRLFHRDNYCLLNFFDSFLSLRNWSTFNDF